MIRLPWLNRRPTDPVAAAYVAGTPVKVGSKTPLHPLRFVVVDAETTGFDFSRDRILSLAAIPVEAGVIQLRTLRSWLVYHSDAPMTEAVRVHGILPADARTGEPEARVLRELLPMITGAILVGHHIGFDIGMLNAALDRHFGVRVRNPSVDTAQLAMRAVEAFRKTGYPGQRAPSLEELCTHLDLQPLERHTAEGDTFTTADLFMLLCAKYARQMGRPLTAGDLPLVRNS